MKKVTSIPRSTKSRGAAILEYVIIAVGIAIFCTIGILMFGRAAKGQMSEATEVLSGKADSTDMENVDAQAAAERADTDMDTFDQENLARTDAGAAQ